MRSLRTLGPAALLGPILGLLALPSPAHAVESAGTPLGFEWSSPWSSTRVILAVVLAVASVLFAFGVYFRARLNPQRDADSAPWPLDAFGESLALAVLLATCSFLLFFAWLEDDLRPPRAPLHVFPNSLYWLNLHGRWLAILAVGVLISLVTWWMVAHREEGR